MDFQFFLKKILSLVFGCLNLWIISSLDFWIFAFLNLSISGDLQFRIYENFWVFGFLDLLKLWIIWSSNLLIFLSLDLLIFRSDFILLIFRASGIKIRFWTFHLWILRYLVHWVVWALHFWFYMFLNLWIFRLFCPWISGQWSRVFWSLDRWTFDLQFFGSLTLWIFGS